MAKKKTEDLLKIEFSERNGAGRIVSAKPIKTQIGEMNFYVSYDARCEPTKTQLGEFTFEFYGEPVSRVIYICLRLKDDLVDVYEDVGFFDGNNLITDDHFLHVGDVELTKLLNASYPVYQVKSKLRKYPDVIVEGPEMTEFLKSLQALAELMADPNAILTYIYQHDDSFESLYNAQKVELEQQKQKEKKQQAAERRERKARQKAEEKTRQRKRIMIVIGLLLLLAGIYGLYKGFVICLADESNIITGLLVMGISFFLAMPAGLAIISNNKN